MSKIFKNECFRVAVDYLRSKNVVKTDKELATKIGVTAAALSRIRKDLTTISDDTLYKMNEAFGDIFNMAYFRGESIYMLVEDVVNAKQKAVSPSTDEPTANIIELYATLIKEVEGLRQQLKEQIAETQKLNNELRQSIAHIKGMGITYKTPDEAPRLAAEDNKK